MIDRLLEALDEVDYPRDRLFTVLVDDGSDDATWRKIESWASGRARVRAIRLPKPAGKPRALNEGIAAAPPSDLVVVCDADLRPRPDFLRRLAAPFGDPTVAATAGYRRPENADKTAISRYAAVEAWTHQLVTSAGKDRLDLNPPLLAFCAYRRRALEELGWFRTDAHGEDAESTVALTRAGWRTRFVPEAVADNLVADRWRDYWRQHLRWSSSLFEAPHGRRQRPRTSPARRIEIWLMSAGYADRIALLAAVPLAAVGALPLWIVPAYLGVTAVEVVVAIGRGGAGRRTPLFLLSTATLFLLDIVASFAAFASHPWRRGRGWTPRRSAEARPVTREDLPG
jgi:cellulose synthase/poly-beta-1,6-N-acetylglucosamine synthase-like glycosyltransferase